jgi:hypothetical protein
MLSYKLNITTQDFSIILYWSEEKGTIPTTKHKKNHPVAKKDGYWLMIQ